MELERNKDVALRAKELAEKSLLQKDLGGARTLAMKAQEIYPNLDGLPQLLATIDVYITAEEKVNGEVDWYRILGVQPLADDETIRRQYRKLALTMHPDRNKSVGADGAFNLISQAWSLLSDKAKRINYDQKYSLTVIYQGHSGGKSSIPANQNGLHNISNAANRKDRDLGSATHPIPTPASPVTLKQTFWTMCNFCRTKFEFHTVYINRDLVCTICHKPFFASETSPPPVYRNASSTLRIPLMKQRNLKSTTMERNVHVLGRTPVSAVGSGPSSMPGGISSVPTSSSNVAEDPGAVRMSSENLKRTVGDLTKMPAVNSSVGSRTFSMPSGISSVPTSSSNVAEATGAVRMSSENLKRTLGDLTKMPAVNSSVGSRTFSMPGGISSVPTSSSNVAEAPGAVRMASENLKRTLGDLTKMPAVNSSDGSCTFSMLGGISSVPTSSSNVAEAPGAVRMSSENLKGTLGDLTKMPAVNSSDGSRTFSMPGGISSVPTSSSNVAEAPGAVRMSSENLKRMLDDLTKMPTVNSSVGSHTFSMPGGISRVPTSSSNVAEAPGVFRMSFENLKRRLEDLTPLMRDEAQFGKTHVVDRTGADLAFQSSCFGLNSNPKGGDRARKKRRTDEHKVDGGRRNMETNKASQNEGTNLAPEFASEKYGSDTARFNTAGSCKRNGIRDVSQLQMRNILMEKARKEILKKIDEWNASSVSKNLGKSKNTDTEIKEKDKERAINGVKPGAQEYVDSETTGKKCFSADPEPEVPDSLSMNVPDPDFHDFDGDRIENAFGENQVWAVYDNDDGMPRYYCLIHNVISKNPFQMRISWLNAKGNDELAPIKWVSSGFPKTSGNFRIGKYGLYSTLNSFSHMVEWTKGSRGVVHIYPKKGDVWAIYQNWSSEWNEFTEDEIIQKYVMVEVLEDYSEEQGVNIAPLVKVAGFRTVFRKNADPRKTNNISKGEMFRFSHQVPSFLLTGEEGQNAPKGCLELDPAAMPVELLQVVPEDVEQEMAMITEKTSEDGLRQNDSNESLREKVCMPGIKYVYKRKRLRQKKEL